MLVLAMHGSGVCSSALHPWNHHQLGVEASWLSVTTNV